MILDLRALDEFPAETTVCAGPGELSPFDDSVIRVDGVAVELAVQKSVCEYFCQGRVKARVVLECARCLGRFEAELSGKTEFVVCSDQEAAETGGADDEDYVCYHGSDLRVDIIEPVRQSLTLALAMKPLCSADCRGLCRKCGVNLNEETCDCDINTTDARWDDLKNLHPE